MSWNPAVYALASKRALRVEKDHFGRLWRYQPDVGHYISDGVESAVHREVGRLIAANSDGSLPPPNLDNGYRSRYGDDVVMMLRQLEPKINLNPSPPIITTRNKTLKFQIDGTLISEPHHPENFATVGLHLPFDHDATAKPSVWNRFLHDILPDSGDRLLLQQWAGATLNPGRHNPKGALFVYGDADSGKSVLADTLTHLYGSRNVAGVTPHDLSRDQYAAFSLVGVLANIVPDISGQRIEDPSMFKMVTSGFDRITLRPMYSQESFAFYPTCGNLFTGNALPSSWVDNSDGFFTRRLALKAHTIPAADRNPRLRAELQNELPGILNWAIVGHKKTLGQRLAVVAVPQNRQPDTTIIRGR